MVGGSEKNAMGATHIIDPTEGGEPCKARDSRAHLNQGELRRLTLYNRRSRGMSLTLKGSQRVPWVRDEGGDRLGDGFPWVRNEGD